MKKNVVKDKSFDFALGVINLYKYLTVSKREFVISKQLLRSGTSIGALIREAEHAESKKDFIHKFAIAQKETNESQYWLELLWRTNYISENQFSDIFSESKEIIRLITAIIKTTKSREKIE